MLMPRQPPPERESRRQPRDHFISWRVRHDPDGLQPYDNKTGRPGILIRAIGFSIGRSWFIGLTKYRFDAEQPS